MSTGRGVVVAVLGWMVVAAAGCGPTPLTRPDDGSGGGGRGVSAAGGRGGASVAGHAGTAGRGGAASGETAGGGATAGGGGATGDLGGAGGASSNPNGVACLPVTMPRISDFSFVPDAGSTSSVHFGDATTFSGEEYVYPTGSGYPLSSDVTGNNWHISGTIGDYSGFGLSFD